MKSMEQMVKEADELKNSSSSVSLVLSFGDDEESDEMKSGDDENDESDDFFANKTETYRFVTSQVTRDKTEKFRPDIRLQVTPMDRESCSSLP